MGHRTVDAASFVGGGKAGPVTTDAVGKLMFLVEDVVLLIS